MGDNIRNGNTRNTPFTRALDADVQRQMGILVPSMMADFSKTEPSTCPHVKRVSAVGGAQFKYESSLEPVSAGKDANDQIIIKQEKRELEFFGKKVEVVMNKYKCSECGKQILVPADATSYSEFTKTMVSAFTLLDDTIDYELYMRAQYGSAAMPMSGNNLLLTFLTGQGDLSRLSRFMFVNYVKDLKDKYTRLTNELEGKAVYSTDGLAAAAFVDVLSMGGVTNTVYGQINGNLEMKPIRDNYMNEFLPGTTQIPGAGYIQQQYQAPAQVGVTPQTTTGAVQLVVKK